MRRFVAIVGLLLAVGGFVTIAFSVAWDISFYIPVGLILGGFICLAIAKRMYAGKPQDTESSSKNDAIDGECSANDTAEDDHGTNK